MRKMKEFVELERGSFELVRRFADESEGEREYYHAILDGAQKGRVFVDDAKSPGAVLFWHYSGFGFAAGRPDGAFLNNILAMIRQEHPCFVRETQLKKRFVLQQDDPLGARIIADADGIIRSERLCFTFDGERAQSRRSRTDTVCAEWTKRSLRG